MPTYSWKGKNRGGSAQEGVLEADNKDAVIALLRKQQVLVTAVTEKGKEIAFPKIFQKGVGQKDLAIFTRQFSVMIDAGLPLVQCLEILGSQQENRTFQQGLYDVRQDVEGGATLADALGKHPKIFSELYVNMLAAGEAAGILDTILRRLSEYIEKAVALQGNIKKASVYPIAVIGIAVGVVWVIMTFVIPVFAALFQGLGGGAQLPLPTRICIALSNVMLPLSIITIILAFIGVYAYREAYKTERGRRAIDSFMLKLPVVGMLLRNIALARFCRTLGTLISSGVPILDALDITSKTAGNQIVSDAISATRRSIEQGKTIAEPLGQTDVFPSMVTQMISVGEQTGALDTMLNKIADFYDEEVDNEVATLLTLMEPILFSFLGVTIGIIVVAMYMQIFALISVIQ